MSSRLLPVVAGACLGAGIVLVFGFPALVLILGIMLVVAVLAR